MDEDHVVSQQEEKMNEMDDQDEVESSSRLFIRNLPYSCTEEDLRKCFSKFGELAEDEGIHVPIGLIKCGDRCFLASYSGKISTESYEGPLGKSKGFAFVLFVLPDDATTAKESLDNTIFQGRLLHIMKARPLPQKISEVSNIIFSKSTSALHYLAL